MIGRLHSVVIDCKDPDKLGVFYQNLLGLARTEDTPEWVTLGGADDVVHIALQRVEKHIRPKWPDPKYPQQMHLDVLVSDLDDAEAQVTRLGARLLEGSDKPTGFRVYADPEGHPFCLVTAEGIA